MSTLECISLGAQPERTRQKHTKRLAFSCTHHPESMSPRRPTTERLLEDQATYGLTARQVRDWAGNSNGRGLELEK
jgi:hypothetical protein